MKTLMVAAALAWFLALAVPSHVESRVANDVHRYMADRFGLEANDFRSLERRQPVTRSLSTRDDREVATLGIIRIGAPAMFYVEQLHDIVTFKKASTKVLAIGRFSNPPRIADVAELSFDDRDLESLRRCRVGDCDIQLSAEAVERFRRDVLWGSTGDKAMAEQTMRHLLVDLVNRYREDGDAALMTYADRDPPLSLSHEFRSMVASPAAILVRFPNLYGHILEFPHDPIEGIDDLIYWSKETMGPAVIISVTHLAIAPLLGGPERAYVAASRQLYGSHYFDSSLGITVLLDVSDGSTPAMLMAYVNRSRLDALGGFWGGVKRAIVRSRARSALGSSLVEARDLVEHRFHVLTKGPR